MEGTAPCRGRKSGVLHNSFTHTPHMYARPLTCRASPHVGRAINLSGLMIPCTSGPDAACR